MKRVIGLAALIGILVANILTFSAASQSPVTTAIASPEAATPLPEFASIVWARSIDAATNAPAKKTSRFITTDEVIYAVLPVEHIEAGTVVRATWSYNGMEAPSIATSVTIEKDLASGWIAFALHRPTGGIWPIGEFAITIAINGKTVATSSVDVTVPPS